MFVVGLLFELEDVVAAAAASSAGEQEETATKEEKQILFRSIGVCPPYSSRIMKLTKIHERQTRSDRPNEQSVSKRHHGSIHPTGRRRVIILRTDDLSIILSTHVMRTHRRIVNRGEIVLLMIKVTYAYKGNWQHFRP